MRALCQFIALFAVGLMGVVPPAYSRAEDEPDDSAAIETTATPAASADSEPDPPAPSLREADSITQSEEVFASSAGAAKDLLDRTPHETSAPLVRGQAEPPRAGDDSVAREIRLLTVAELDARRSYTPVRTLREEWHEEGCECCNTADYCYRLFGSISAGTGESTFADNEFQRYELNQEIITPGGSRYLFYQRYRVEHTYLNFSELELGARQHLRDWALGGDLRMRQEFKQHDDREFDRNDRQEGLFDLRFNPRSADGRNRADLSYRYIVRAYETFSPLSFKMHRGRVRLERELDCYITLGAEARLQDYNYSIGSDRDNRREGGQVDLEIRPNDDLTIYAEVEADEKTYEVRRTRDFNERDGGVTIRWRPDERSRLNARVRSTQHERPFDPDRSYDQQLADVQYQRQLNQEWDVDLRGLTRNRNYGDPLDDLTHRAAHVTFTNRPSAHWSFFLGAGRDDYNYAFALRAFARDRARIGAQYYGRHVGYGLELERQRSIYDADPDRDWTRDALRANVDYRLGRHELRLYGQLALLDQANPLSVNDYRESVLSAQWVYELDPCTDFVLIYDSSVREYDLQDAIRDTRVEARLNFEL